MTDRDFHGHILQYNHPGNSVLDLGSGEEDFARMFADRGAIVTAVDAKYHPPSEESITFQKVCVEDFIAKRGPQRYDMVFIAEYFTVPGQGLGI